MLTRMKQPYPSSTAERIIVRLPDGMRDRLADLAKLNNRSTNAEVVVALQRWLDGGRSATEPEPLQIILDTSGMPTSWAEVSMLLDALLMNKNLTPHSIHVVVNTVSMEGSRDRKAETERLADLILKKTGAPSQIQK
jgi:hypothetical protein